MSFDFFLPVLTYPDPTPVAGLAATATFGSSCSEATAPALHDPRLPPSSCGTDVVL